MAPNTTQNYSAPGINVRPPLGQPNEEYAPPPGPPPGHLENSNVPPIGSLPQQVPLQSRATPPGMIPPPGMASPQVMAPPPGMVAVPAAAVGGHAGPSIQSGMMGASGLAYGLGDSNLGMDMAFAGVGANIIGQRYNQHKIRQAIADPNAPMVYVDENSRAGRRAKRRERRAERRGKAHGGIAGFFSGGKSEGEQQNSSSSDSEHEGFKSKKK